MGYSKHHKFGNPRSNKFPGEEHKVAMHARGFVVFLSCVRIRGGYAIDITKHSQQEQLVKDRKPSEPMVLARDIQLSLPAGLSMRPL